MPDGYGRGRIIGDYRRVAPVWHPLSGTRTSVIRRPAVESGAGRIFEATIRLREELAEHRRAAANGEMAAKYGYDIPARRGTRRKRYSTLLLIWRAVKSQKMAVQCRWEEPPVPDIYIERD